MQDKKGGGRSAGGVRLTKQDEKLLDERINANTLVYSKRSLVAVAFMAAFQPVYLSHAVNGLDWFVPANLLLYVAVMLFTVYMLTQAYMTMVESEFWRRQRHYNEVRECDGKLLQKLRLQVAVGYTLFFVNSVFSIVCTVLHIYIFRQSDPRASFIMSPTVTAALLWLIAQKNEESRRRIMAQHK
ncbi:translocon-associated protein subunit gamma [Trypanosoma rangeli]|uniref:Translocon-associated protein subunit gamma n=1 Tax=Trypanosoma rangeli TaxID=5698 RepID=A0A3S5IS67_TRYRA|nr:translocon-associated protein subunit gamma [Trypanosoma rangeli]RNF10087.1 translocon-associated protein subunit gamma [Trypanosoma rangeli]|eukprot:RNF10087.1 translocon-associated protein subunit gamma [Trypanosoma rangeli]